MIGNKKIVIVMPAYNAEKTLEQTYNEIPFTIVDDVVLVDDKSSDKTSEKAAQIGIKHIIIHDKNKGYGGNQKSCYRKALELNADIIVMLHPDYQYTPKLLEAMIYPIANDLFQVMLAARTLGKGALKGGMPLYKYIANRFLTFFQNVLLNQKLAEYHTGYRAFSKEVIEKLPLESNSDDFVFDNQMLAQITFAGYEIGEITCPTKYFDEASSINFTRSLKYGWGCVWVSIQYFISKNLGYKFRIFKKINS